MLQLWLVGTIKLIYLYLASKFRDNINIGWLYSWFGSALGSTTLNLKIHFGLPFLSTWQRRTPKVVRWTKIVEIQELFAEKSFDTGFKCIQASSYALNMKFLPLVFMRNSPNRLFPKINVKRSTSIVCSQHSFPLILNTDQSFDDIAYNMMDLHP